MTSLESFWETCDRDGDGEHPLVRELCYRLDALQRCRLALDDAEDIGNDEAVEVLSRQFDRQQSVIKRIRQELERGGPPSRIPNSVS